MIIDGTESTWRTDRTTLLTALSAIGILILVTAGTGIIVRGSGRSAYGKFCTSWKSLQGCTPETTLTLVTVLTIALPVVLGVFVGITVFSRSADILGPEQSHTVGEIRMYASRVAVVFLPITLAMTGLGLVLGWSRTVPTNPWFATSVSSFSTRFEYPVFETSGIVTGGYTLLALMIGGTAALAMWSKRSSAVLTVVLMVAVLVAFSYGVRQHYASPDILVQDIDGQKPDGGSYDTQFGLYSSSYVANQPIWVVGADYVGITGHVVKVNFSVCDDEKEKNERGRPRHQTPEENDAFDARQRQNFNACIESQGVDHFEVYYQPDSRYWQFQASETGLTLVLATLVLVPALVRSKRIRT